MTGVDPSAIANEADRDAGDPRVARRFRVGLVAVVVYVAFAAGVANLLTAWVDPADPAAAYALAHVPVLIPLIVAGVLFVRWAGWNADVWRTPNAFEVAPRRRWMLVVPLLLLVQPVLTLASAPWSEWEVAPVLLALVVTAMVGFGEELYFRGILRASLRERHGETVGLLVTSVAFGLAHSFGGFIHGEPLGFIAFQVFVTALAGAAYYAAFLATGRLWVPIVLHGLGDFSLLIGGGGFGGASSDADPSPANIVIQAVLWGLTAVVLISCIRGDVRARRNRTAR